MLRWVGVVTMFGVGLVSFVWCVLMYAMSSRPWWQQSSSAEVALPGLLALTLVWCSYETINEGRQKQWVRIIVYGLVGASGLFIIGIGIRLIFMLVEMPQLIESRWLDVPITILLGAFISLRAFRNMVKIWKEVR